MSASAGTFIGASLETAGQFYQSYVLDLITYSLGGLVVLCFVVGVMASIIAVVFQGGARSGLLLLLGPALYLAAVFQRTVVPPVVWTQAPSVEAQEKVADSVDVVTEQTNYVAKPSALFNGFDRLVSGFVRQTSAALRTTGENMDLELVAKSQLLGYLMSPEITDPGLKELLHLSLLGECRAMVQAGQEMSDPRNRPAERCEWGKSYNELAGRTNFKLTPNASKYVASLDVDVPVLLEKSVVDDLPAELARLKADLAQPNSYYGFQPFSCDISSGVGVPASGDAAEVAQAAVQANAYVRNRIMQTVGGENVNGIAVGLPRTSDAVQSLSAYFDERDAKIQERMTQLSAESFTCHEVWNLVYVALHYEAAMQLETVKAEGKKDGFNVDKLIKDLAAMSGVDDMKDLIKAISRKMFRLENAKGSSAAIIQEYANRGPDVRNIEVNDSEDINSKIRQDTLDAEWTGQASLIQTAMMLPYYQGLILFFLSISFPFFALLLAIPGRATGFFMWFGLWFWVKSWDIGYALVSMLDRVMYSIFVARMDSGYVSAKTTLDLDFAAAIAALRDSDPTFEVGTYYMIMGVCVLAIPVISAQLVVQVSAGIASIVRGQILNAQQAAANAAARMQQQPYQDKLGVWHQGYRGLGSGAMGDTTQQALNEAAKKVALERNIRGVTTIDNADPTVLPTRTPNMIATSGRRSPSVLPPPSSRTAGNGANNLIPTRQRSRWEAIDYTADMNDPDVVEGPTASDGQKKLETPGLERPRLPETK